MHLHVQDMLQCEEKLSLDCQLTLLLLRLIFGEKLVCYSIGVGYGVLQVAATSALSNGDTLPDAYLNLRKWELL
ncbi:hypothetical protein L6164_016788 [Bauhinia variegata]|uniref:Uncharacterized protein n=1 Tax=Bauhinia variegata TaxID=167791 RepID=A0ACB9N6Z3_BAUVA|nr:hypothetical protein L6164_016788 [Bauhinia variegata]